MTLSQLAGRGTEWTTCAHTEGGEEQRRRIGCALGGILGVLLVAPVLAPVRGAADAPELPESDRSVARWSSPGSPLVGVLKPDLVAPAFGVLGAVPGPEGWDFVTGTSAAAAYTAGAAATLLARTGWPATTVRSALSTTAAPLPGDVLHSGAGRLRPDAAIRPGLVFEVDRDDYRAWLSGRQHRLNPPSVLLADGQRRVRRTITNILGRARATSPPAPWASGGMSR